MRLPRIIAHRCGGALAPENTLAGLRIAARLGVRGVEFDAMLSADGIPVVIHDETLERTTSGTGCIASVMAADITRLDAGVRHHRAFAGEPLPTLAAVLQVCAALGLWANIEIKPSAGADADTGRVVALSVAQHADRLRAGLVMSSFSMEALVAAANAAPSLARALLVEALPQDWRTRLSAVKATTLNVSCAALETDSARLSEICQAGIVVGSYTVNNRALADRLFSVGVQAVFTDRPDLWAANEM